MKGRIAVKTAVFLLIGGMLFHSVEMIFVDKTSYARYSGWKAAERVDILILGNSHADCGFRGAEMTEEFRRDCGADVRVFNYGIYGMRIEQMYYFTKEILKTHVPELIVLETFAFCPMEDEQRGVLAHRAFDPFPLSLDKIQAINACVREDHVSFYIPIIQYHTRWKELSAVDVQLAYSRKSGSPYGGNGSNRTERCEDPGDGWFQQEPPEEIRALSHSEEEYLNKLLALIEEQGIELLFVSVPYKEQMNLDSMEQIKINNYLREQYVNGDTIRMLDMNRMWKELDFDYEDLFNPGHAGKSGADKITACLLEYLKANYDISGMAA